MKKKVCAAVIVSFILTCMFSCLGEFTHYRSEGTLIIHNSTDYKCSVNIEYEGYVGDGESGLSLDDNGTIKKHLYDIEPRTRKKEYIDTSFVDYSYSGDDYTIIKVILLYEDPEARPNEFTFKFESDHSRAEYAVRVNGDGTLALHKLYE